MPFLRESERRHLEHLFEEALKDPVTLVVFTQEFECQYCRENVELMEELASIDDRIRVKVYEFRKDEDKAKQYGVDKIPATVLVGRKDYGIRFFGIPAGYEFTALVEDIMDVSKGVSQLPERARALIAERVKEPLHIQVFVTPTCPYCPRAVRAAHQMALESELIRADMVESIEFPHLANRYMVMAVPKTVVNGTPAFEGALPEELFVQLVLEAAGRRLSI